MKPRNSKRGREGKVTRLRPRRRGQGDIDPTTPKSYTLPFAAIVEIRRVAREYGSQGRALQVASEILVRMRKPPAVAPADPDTLVRMTYKLTPRTIRLIDELARTHYDNAGQVISACLKTLSMKKIS